MKIHRPLIALILSFGFLFVIMLLFGGNSVPSAQAALPAVPVASNFVSLTPLLTLTGEAAFNNLGVSTASAGDVNGDGFADILVGALGYNSFHGRVYLYLGSATGPSATPMLTLTGEAADNYFGLSVASAGDVNDDGFADVLIGAYGYNNRQGRAYLYLGSSAGPSATPTFTLTGETAYNSFGVSVASAGDVNGDNFDDVLVGADHFNAGQGRVYLYLGNATSLTETPALTLTGESADALLGVSVASAGDVNGDHFADVLMGAQGYNSFQGRAYVYLGSSTGLSVTPALTLTGEALGRYFGRSVASAGDVNGDGFADALVGAYGYNNYLGRTYVYLGGPVGLSSTPALTLTGEGTNSRFGYSVASAGDVNNDGFADVLVGAHGYSTGQGSAYLYMGSDSGLSATPAQTIIGEAAFNLLGTSVASAGDVNGDSYAEVLVGADLYGSSSQGRAYLYGHIPSLPPQPTGVTPSINAVGVPLTSSVSIAFDESIDLTPVTTGTFVVHGSQSPIFTGTYSLSDLSHTITLDPSRSFFPGEVVRTVITTDTLNITGTHMLTSTQWQFTAGSAETRRVGDFTLDTATTFTGVSHGRVGWGDYDNDGDLDILLIGDAGDHPVVEVWRNNGLGEFALVPMPFTGAFISVAWGDYDNDGHLDVFLGAGGTQVGGQLWHNNGDGTFSLNSTFLDGVYISSVAWGDYDNDGYLDILLAGNTGITYVSQVWHNDGTGTFTMVPISLTGSAYGDVAWGDYDNDGDLDVLLAGSTVSDSITHIWRNDGAGTFTLSPVSLTNAAESSVAWGDYDNDADLDILLTGNAGGSRVTQVWRNDGGEIFTLIPTSLTGIRLGNAEWGDYDNDSDLDILLTGWAGSDAVTQLWRNNGVGSFTQVSTPFPGVYFSDAAWGDYDNDGDLDVLLAGFTNEFDRVAQIWRNNDYVDIPITDLMATSDSPTVIGHLTTFQATITAGSNVTYVWNFGDGTPTVSGNPVAHTYAMTEIYTVIVTATNSANMMTATTQATVIPLYKLYLPMAMKD